MIYYVIPARAWSKGFPGKNSILFNHTAEMLKAAGVVPESVIVSTDCDTCKAKAEQYGFRVHHRIDNCDDFASVRDVLIDVSDDLRMKQEDLIVCLYLTYPGRAWADVVSALNLMFDENATSLLCKKPVKTHPYMCVDSDGKRFIQHDLCRRQEYPEAFEISHYVFAAYVVELESLDRNMYAENTVFYTLDHDVVDVDTKEDYDRFIQHV